MIKTQLLMAALLGMAGTAQAVENGGFAAGLAGWQSLGDVAVLEQAAWLGTAHTDYADDFPAAAGAYNLSGLAAAEAGVAGGVEEFAGLAVGALDQGDQAFEGSVLTQTFTVQAGDVLRFDWSLHSNEGPAGFQDYAFLALDGTLLSLASAADATLAADQFAWQTGRSTFTWQFTGAGTHTLALGVVDVGDYSVSSALWVDNVVLTPVPEPETWSMLLIGLGLILMAIRRHHHTHHNRIGDPQNA
ncbi:MAG: PEP-CTERM sorting domain-containing protein [Pseudomonadota bacterium]